MTYLFNNPDKFASEAVSGLAAVYPQYVTEVHGGVVRPTETPKNQPALVVGGGSGHYPAFAGWVGQGFAHGSACGNVFASPSASQVYSVARNSENGGGVILGFGNYAGDVLHFGLAAEKLRHEGIDVRVISVSDDIMSNTKQNHRDRRGVAGDLPVFKVIGAAIEAGADLDEAERVGWKANDATRSFGIAFDGCQLPGAEDKLFQVKPGEMGVGLGIHGEPGIRDEEMGTADQIAETLVKGILAEEPTRGENGYNGRVTAILNGLGTVKYEELYVVYRKVNELLEDRGLTVVAPESGEFVTSLDMAGISLTIVFLDDELEKYWLAPCDTPAFRRVEAQEQPKRTSFWTEDDQEIPEASEDSKATAQSITEVLQSFQKLMEEKEPELGKIDAIAGDGDHGQGMMYGSRGAAKSAAESVEKGAGSRTALLLAGASWSESAGGTSGALWGAALTAAGGVFSDDQGSSDKTILESLAAGIEAILRLGGAKPGDKTMVDAAVPFREYVLENLDGNPANVVAEGARIAREAAEKTADITARKGRSRVLGEKSLGVADPGALSFSMLMANLGEYLAK